MRRIALILLLPAVAFAQTAPSGGPYVMNKQAIAGGGAAASAAGLTLVGTVGQAATQVAAGGTYVLSGGFHGPAPAGSPLDPVFRDGFEN